MKSLVSAEHGKHLRGTTYPLTLFADPHNVIGLKLQNEDIFVGQKIVALQGRKPMRIPGTGTLVLEPGWSNTEANLQDLCSAPAKGARERAASTDILALVGDHAPEDLCISYNAAGERPI
jgi:hypothetical protein